MMYIVYEKDYVFSDAICGLADSLEKAEAMLEKIAQEALVVCLAADPEDSGIYWDDMTEAQQEKFYNEEIKGNWAIKEMELNTYITYNEVKEI